MLLCIPLDHTIGAEYYVLDESNAGDASWRGQAMVGGQAYCLYRFIVFMLQP